MHIVTVTEMRELETQAELQYGLTSPILMEKAGKSAADLFLAQLPPQRSIQGLEMLFLIGPGNNGGDGLIMAKHLEQAGASISLYHWKERRLVVGGGHRSGAETASELETLICTVDYIIDALLGIGTSRPLPDDMAALLARVRQEREQRETVRLIAIDLPTGLNADIGAVDPGTIPVDATITLACPKQGFFFFPGRDYIGELSVGDIGLPPDLEAHLTTEMLTAPLVSAMLPPRPLNSNKGTFGRVFLFCGSPAYPGSAFLAGSGAARAGAGLVTLAVTEAMLPIYATTFHEATFAVLPEEQAMSYERAERIISHLPGYRSLLIGPGLGQSPSTREVILQILEYVRSLPVHERPHVVIDADGLNNLSALEHWWTLLPEGTVITPHPGEMGRLCNGKKVSGGDFERLDLTRTHAKEWQVTLALKGACTIIADPTGRTRMNWLANAAMASAGTGDVLAGMIAGLLAQGLQPFDAASSGVYLHALTGHLVSSRTGPAGLLASDLLPLIPHALTSTRAAHQ